MKRPDAEHHDDGWVELPGLLGVTRRVSVHVNPGEEYGFVTWMMPDATLTVRDLTADDMQDLALLFADAAETARGSA